MKYLLLIIALGSGGQEPQRYWSGRYETLSACKEAAEQSSRIITQRNNSIVSEMTCLPYDPDSATEGRVTVRQATEG